MADKVTVFTKNNCIQCKMTKRFLKEHNIEFEERNISENPELIDNLKKRGFFALPVVDIEGNESISGFRPEALSKLCS
ncbi:MAG: glutaredoxin-like protein NrdH [Firmicutes bacterium]|uniref:Glutaredoxin-like protein NrdH n=1 Tax=Candidatus Gallilactobacillus intestinavium TaxID=2840838 RepID=A0A9D9E628_9LACO|nr:glutaredoxin-like protein NrdH [Candidatus Gallilactobacillus intestinavium]